MTTTYDKPRSLRLTDEDWEKLQKLGVPWFAEAIRNAQPMPFLARVIEPGRKSRSLRIHNADWKKFTKSLGPAWAIKTIREAKLKES